jgi:hypothetical protein
MQRSDTLILDFLGRCGISNLTGIIEVDIKASPGSLNIYIERHYATEDKKFHLTNNSQIVRLTEFVQLN